MFFELNGQPREVTVRDKSLKVESTQRAKGRSGQSRAGRRADSGSCYVASPSSSGKTVKKGDRLLVMEAMKMQTTVYAPIDGKVQELLVQVGHTVEAKDLLVIIA